MTSSALWGSTLTDLERPNPTRQPLYVGDLWMLAWNDEPLGLVVISRVIDTYALVMPTTPTQVASFAPGLTVTAMPLGTPLTLWPMMETGIGSHLLHHRIGTLLTESVVKTARTYGEDGGPSPLPVASGNYTDPGNPVFLSALLNHMQGLCFHRG